MYDEPVDFVALRAKVVDSRDQAARLCAALTELVNLIDLYQSGDPAPGASGRMIRLAAELDTLFGAGALGAAVAEAMKRVRPDA